MTIRSVGLGMVLKDDFQWLLKSLLEPETFPRRLKPHWSD